MITPEIRILQKEVAFLRERNDTVTQSYKLLNQKVTGILNTQINTPPSPSANLLFNGEVGYSVNSWFDSAYTTDDKAKEAAHWFSHDGAMSAIVLDETDARSGSANNTLKKTDHTTYDALFSRWNASNGWAELNLTTTLDNLLPSNIIDATTPLARVSFVAAKRNQYIEIPEASLMFAGIYDNTTGQEKFLTGSLGFTAEISAVAASTIERRYKIHIVSDRGYSLLSPEITILNAPADGFFSSTVNIVMDWKPSPGQLRADIYEYVPSTGIYKQIAEISSGFSYVHQGTSLSTVAGYPSSTGTERQAIYFTRTGEIADLATNGVSARWDTVNFPIVVPDNYDKSATTGRQWVRIGLTVAPNLFVTNCSTNGTADILAPAAVFLDEYGLDNLYNGLTYELYDSTDILLATGLISLWKNETGLTLDTVIPAGTGRKLRIVGGGFHGVYLDKIHLGFQQNTSYAPNALDNRELQPVAAPTSSQQGGSGGGSGGGIRCVAGDTPVKQSDDSWLNIEQAETGNLWASAEFKPNLLLKLKQGFDNVRGVYAENGCYVEATDTERFVTDRTDHNGTPLYQLRTGDYVLTEIDGRIESSRLVKITPYLRKTLVYSPELSNSRLFIAGRLKIPKWRQIINRLKFWRKNAKTGAFILHNRKQFPEDIIIN